MLSNKIRYDVVKGANKKTMNIPSRMEEVEFNGKKFTMNNQLKSNLDTMKKELQNDWDFIILVDGMERAGKSTLVAQCAYYLTEGKFSLPNYCFTPLQFENAIKNAEKNGVIVYDEAVTGLDIKDTMTRIAKGLKKLIAQIGYKNLIIFVILPSFFDFQKYWAIHRSDLLIHVYTFKELTGHLKRGLFQMYGRNNKKYLYINGRQFYNYNVQKFDLAGKFNSFFPFDKDEYNNLKDKSVNESPDDEGDPQGVHISHKIGLMKLIKACIRDKLFTTREIAQICGLHYNTARRLYLQKEFKNRRGRVIGTIDEVAANFKEK